MKRKLGDNDKRKKKKKEMRSIWRLEKKNRMKKFDIKIY